MYVCCVIFHLVFFPTIHSDSLMHHCDCQVAPALLPVSRMSSQLLRGSTFVSAHWEKEITLWNDAYYWSTETLQRLCNLSTPALPCLLQEFNSSDEHIFSPLNAH